MAKDLIIGGASGYKYDDVKYWINSIIRSGFEGDIVLAVTNVSIEELEKIAQKGVKILAYGQKDANGNYSSNSNMPPHVERFFHIWNFLNTTDQNYRFVITTDVRDVVFQSDPTIWMQQHLREGRELIAAGEGLKYSDEPWGNNNYMQAFGPFFHNLIKDKQIYNVGVIAGLHRNVRDLMLQLLQMSVNRPIPIVDQAVYNFLLNIPTIGNNAILYDNDAGWAVNLGTTLGAIASGSGDIGMRNDPTAQLLYQAKYLCEQPEFMEDGTVIAPRKFMYMIDPGTPEYTKEPYCIVHQYDRVAGLAEKIRVKYND